MSDEVQPARAGVERVGVAVTICLSLRSAFGTSGTSAISIFALCAFATAENRVDRSLAPAADSSMYTLITEGRSSLAAASRRSMATSACSRRRVARAIDPERANRPVEGLKDVPARERPFDGRDRVDRVDRERALRHVLGLNLARGAPPVLRLRAGAARERGAMRVRERVVLRDELADDSSG